MTEFGNYLSSLGASQGLNDQEFARKICIDPSTLSRYKQGTRPTIERGTLERICRLATNKREEQAGLLAAYLSDQRVGPARNDVEVIVKTSPRGAERTSVPALEDPYERLAEMLRKNKTDKSIVASMVVMIDVSKRSKSFRNAFKNLAEIAAEIH